VKKKFYLSPKKIRGPFRVDSLKTFKALIYLSRRDNLIQRSSPVCYAGIPEVQQAYKNLEKL